MDSEEIVKMVAEKKIKMHEIDKYAANGGEAARIRRKIIEAARGINLVHIANSSIDADDAGQRNIENFVGATQVPLGKVEDDLRVNGRYAKGDYPILLATTEGKLVAGISRGVAAINEAGGANTVVVNDGMTRDVLLAAKNAGEGQEIAELVKSDEWRAFIADEFSKYTKHGRLVEVRPFVSGRYVHLRFKAFTGAAMGMNMVTIAANATAKEIIKRLEGKGISAMVIGESGNMCSDKKPAYINVVEGRGVSVIAEAVIPREYIVKKLRTTPEAIAELNKAKNLIGSALAGSHGYNGHVANILAAMYIAYGQDVAQIVEGSQAITDASVNDDGSLYISVHIPALEVGTYGGGTARETQKEALMLLGLYGDGDKTGKTRLAFAEVVAATCLAGELNLLAVESSGELAKSHAKLKR